MQFLVSIIIPIYNTEAYLGRCLQGIVCQSYKNLEIILVNDGSTDRSTDICKEYASKDNRIKYLSQSNSGASSARNNGLDHAQGDYVMFVDSDDWIDSNMVEELVEDIIKHKTSMVISQVPGDIVVPSDMTVEKFQALETILGGAWWGPVGKLFRKDIVDDIRFPKATISEDYVFMLHAILNSEQIYYKPQCFYHREIREGSLSRLELSKRKFEEYDNVSYVAQFIRENYPQYRKPAEARMAETSIKLLFSIYSNRKTHEFSQQQHMLVKSIRSNIFQYITNREILIQTRALLMMSTTTFGSKMAQHIYSKTH